MVSSKPFDLEQIAIHALDWVGPTIEVLIKEFSQEDPARNELHVVILDPRQRYIPQLALPILAQRTYGEQDAQKWQHDYMHFAGGKAQVCFRTGRSTRDVGENAPHLFLKGDIKYPGGIVFND